MRLDRPPERRPQNARRPFDASVLHPRSWDRRLVAPGILGRTTLLRVLLVSAVGVRLALRQWWEMADRPAELFRPVPVLAWLPGQPGALAIVGIWAVGLAAVGATLALSVPVLRGRPAPRASPLVGPSFLAAWLSLVALAGLWGSSGKVLHNDLLLLMVCSPVLFVPSPRSGARATDRSTAWGWPPRAALAVLGTVYFLTGYQKIRHSGLEWVFSSNMTWVIRQGNPRIPDDLSRSLADQLWLTQAMAGGALLLELAAPVLLAVRRFRLLFAVAAAVMHGSIWALLGLDYYGWVLAVWAVVLPMSVLGDRSQPSVSPAPLTGAPAHPLAPAPPSPGDVRPVPTAGRGR